MTEMNKSWVLRQRPVGDLKEGDLELVESSLVPLEDGEVRTRLIYLSLDPTNRIWMSDVDGYLPPVGIGDAMRGGGLAVVTESRFDGLKEGDIVNTGLGTWSLYNNIYNNIYLIYIFSSRLLSVGRQSVGENTGGTRAYEANVGTQPSGTRPHILSEKQGERAGPAPGVMLTKRGQPHPPVRGMGEYVDRIGVYRTSLIVRPLVPSSNLV